MVSGVGVLFFFLIFWSICFVPWEWFRLLQHFYRSFLLGKVIVFFPMPWLEWWWVSTGTRMSIHGMWQIRFVWRKAWILTYKKDFIQEIITAYKWQGIWQAVISYLLGLAFFRKYKYNDNCIYKQGAHSYASCFRVNWEHHFSPTSKALDRKYRRIGVSWRLNNDMICAYGLYFHRRFLFENG